MSGYFCTGFIGFILEGKSLLEYANLSSPNKYDNILIPTVSGCLSISVFASLVGIPVGIMSSAGGLKICVITAEAKKYESIIKIKKKKDD